MSTTASAATGSTRTSTSSVGFLSTLASEWTKLTSVRSTWITLALGIVLTIGMTALVNFVIGTTWDEWSPADQESFDPIMTSMSGTIFAVIVFAVLGVNLVASEYSSGMMRMTLTATPKRGRVLMAKLIVITVVTTIANAIAIIGMYLVGQAIFESYDLPTVPLSNSDAMRPILVIALTGAVFPIFGACIAFVLRSSAGAITSVMVLIFAPSMFGGLLPQRWQEDVLAFLPGNAADSLALKPLDPDYPMYLSTNVALPVLIAWIVLFVGVAWIMLNRRDA